MPWSRWIDPNTFIGFANFCSFTRRHFSASKWINLYNLISKFSHRLTGPRRWTEGTRRSGRHPKTGNEWMEMDIKRMNGNGYQLVYIKQILIYGSYHDDGGKDVLLRGNLILLTAHDHLDVDGQVDHEEQGAQRSVNKMPVKYPNYCNRMSEIIWSLIFAAYRTRKLAKLRTDENRISIKPNKHRIRVAMNTKPNRLKQWKI